MSTEKHGKRRKILHHRGHSAAKPQPVIVVLSLSEKPDKIDSDSESRYR
uniref:Uncharacterized protein n=1 Tax=Candidatus Kentrum sp. FM TaxID=2126340 RepID=A0A450WTX4_9GAMM|nr:MAG: hypothetical protein BECKFM1743C_GA0114222_100349 [Candidatus Kentron sp. FM]VFJ73026.1 MAG: hypothetical protein BECKFM1743A_GA0114220_106842 [Candidatus Kentron sp. FM]VFK20516.1 MAG: hypothetical protein BECKFM1743B_GA0114221_107032 [Candidatus Kentron sp. FM]